MQMEKTTTEIPFGRPMIGDEERTAVDKVLHGDILVHGPVSEQFEHDFAAFTGAPFAVSCSSATAALHLSYFYLGIGPGDEVIVPAQTHTATAHAVELCGGTSVFLDAEPLTGNVDLSQLERLITPRTRAISIVHFLGIPVDMERLMEVARRHNLFVVEDCALAFGTKQNGIHAGLWGDVGCFSFYPVKHMTTAEGGMLITKNKEIADRIRRTRAFGVDRTPSERKIPGVYDVTMLGFNYRMSEVCAAIGVEQLKKLPGFLATRNQNFRHLANCLKDEPRLSILDTHAPGFVSSHYCLSVVLDRSIASHRLEIVESLKSQGIGTSVYYPRPVPHMSYYKSKYHHTDESFPEASRISYRSIALPVGPHLNTTHMERIAQRLLAALPRQS